MTGTDEPLRVWKDGEQVRITVERHTVEGVVVLASLNGKALILDFDAILAGHVGSMPVLWRDGGYWTVIGSTPVELAPMEGPDAAT